MTDDERRRVTDELISRYGRPTFRSFQKKEDEREPITESAPSFDDPANDGIAHRPTEWKDVPPAVGYRLHPSVQDEMDEAISQALKLFGFSPAPSRPVPPPPDDIDDLFDEAIHDTTEDAPPAQRRHRRDE